jgi:hypothetical protein
LHQRGARASPASVAVRLGLLGLFEVDRWSLVAGVIGYFDS